MYVSEHLLKLSMLWKIRTKVGELVDLNVWTKLHALIFTSVCVSVSFSYAIDFFLYFKSVRD